MITLLYISINDLKIVIILITKTIYKSMQNFVNLIIIHSKFFLFSILYNHKLYLFYKTGHLFLILLYREIKLKETHCAERSLLTIVASIYSPHFVDYYCFPNHHMAHLYAHVYYFRFLIDFLDRLLH